MSLYDTHRRTSRIIKKNCFQIENYIKKVLRRMIDVYKIIITKTLKIKAHILFINVHLKKLLQNSIVNINIKRLINVINIMIKRIKRNLMSKKKRKLKL